MADAVNWVVACAVADLAPESAIGFDHGRDSYAIFRTKSGYYATDGYCTHELASLADGSVIGEVIECPLHQGRFDIRTGKALSEPVEVALRTYPVKVEGDKVMIGLPN